MIPTEYKRDFLSPPIIIRASKSSTKEPACKSSLYDTKESAQLFMAEAIRVSQKNIDHPSREWISNFVGTLLIRGSETRKYGVVLADKLLDFPEDSKLGLAVVNYLQRQFDLLGFHEVHLDEWTTGQVTKLFEKFAYAVEVSTKSYPLVRLSELPAQVYVNKALIADPRIMLFNIYSQSQGSTEAVGDIPLEMRVAIICATIREQLLKKLIPSDVEDYFNQKLFLRKKVQNEFCFIEPATTVSVYEKKINFCFLRMKAETIQSCLLNGCNQNFNSYSYTSSFGEHKVYTIPIPEDEGYDNAQILIERVLYAFNNSKSRLDDIVCLSSRMQALYGDEASARTKEYIDVETQKLTQDGAYALLFSLGYLVAC